MSTLTPKVKAIFVTIILLVSYETQADNKSTIVASQEIVVADNISYGKLVNDVAYTQSTPLIPAIVKHPINSTEVQSRMAYSLGSHPLANVPPTPVITLN